MLTALCRPGVWPNTYATRADFVVALKRANYIEISGDELAPYFGKSSPAPIEVKDTLTTTAFKKQDKFLQNQYGNPEEGYYGGRTYDEAGGVFGGRTSIPVTSSTTPKSKFLVTLDAKVVTDTTNVVNLPKDYVTIQPIKTFDNVDRHVLVNTYEVPFENSLPPRDRLPTLTEYFTKYYVQEGGLPPTPRATVQDNKLTDNTKVMKMQGPGTNKVEPRNAASAYRMKWNDFMKSDAGTLALFFSLNALMFVGSAATVGIGIIFFLYMELLEYLQPKRDGCDPRNLRKGYYCEGWNDPKFELISSNCVDTCGWDLTSTSVTVDAAYFNIPLMMAPVMQEAVDTNVNCRGCYSHMSECAPPAPNMEYSGSGCYKDNNNQWQCTSICRQRCKDDHFPVVLRERSNMLICCAKCPPRYYNIGCGYGEIMVNGSEPTNEFQTYLVTENQNGTCVKCSDTCDALGERGWKVYKYCTWLSDTICESCGDPPANAVWKRNFGFFEFCEFECNARYYYEVATKTCMRLCYIERCAATEYMVSPCRVLANDTEVPLHCCPKCPVGKYKTKDCDRGQANTVCADCPRLYNGQYIAGNADCMVQCYNSSHYFGRSGSDYICCPSCGSYEYTVSDCRPNAPGECAACTYGNGVARSVSSLGNCYGSCPANPRYREIPKYNLSMLQMFNLTQVWSYELLDPERVPSYTLNWRQRVRLEKIAAVYCCPPPQPGFFVSVVCNDTHGNVELPCSACPSDKYRRQECLAYQDAMCEFCPSGQIASGDGLTCQPCPNGTQKTSERTCGVVCPPQSRLRDGAICDFCPVGKFHRLDLQVGSSVIQCEECGPGTYSAETGLTACKACSACGPQQYAAWPCWTQNDTVCAPCPAQPQCPPGRRLAGACPNWRCECNPGFYMSGVLCLKCTTCDSPGTACTAYQDSQCACSGDTYRFVQNGALSCLPCTGCALLDARMTRTACNGTLGYDHGRCQCPVGMEFAEDYYATSVWDSFYWTWVTTYNYLTKKCKPCRTSCASADESLVAEYSPGSQCLQGQEVAQNCKCRGDFSELNPRWYESGQAQFLCTECGPGFEPYSRVKPGGYWGWDCRACPYGKFKTWAGRFMNNSFCVSCKKNYYLPQGSSACSACPAGKFNVLMGQTFCSDCLVGTYRAEQGSVCGMCASGFYAYNTTSAQCTGPSPGSSTCFALLTVTSAGVSDCAAGTISVLNYKMGSKLWTVNVPGATGFTLQFYHPNYTDVYALTTRNLDFIRVYPCMINGLCDGWKEFTGEYRYSPDLQADALENLVLNGVNSFSVEWQAGSSNEGWEMRWVANVAPFASCPPGYVVGGNKSCVKCAAGLFANVSGSTECLTCPAGKFSEQEGSTACTQCSFGKVALLNGSVDCDVCIFGAYSSDPTQDCVRCPQGTYSSGYGASACKNCETGKFTDVVGSYQCSNCTVCEGFSYEIQSCYLGRDRVCKCMDGYEGISGVNCRRCGFGRGWTMGAYGVARCETCDEGKYFDGTYCSTCTYGKFSSVKSVAACDACPVGTYQYKLGSSACVNCPAGSFQVGTEATTCTVCNASTYSLNSSRAGCETCNASSYSCSVQLANLRNGSVVTSCSKGSLSQLQYTNNERYEVLISVPGATEISLELLQVDPAQTWSSYMTMSTEVDRDFLEVYNCSQRTRGCLAYNLSGIYYHLYDIPEYLTFKSSSVLLAWQSSAQVTYAGWKLRWFGDRPNCLPCDAGKFAAFTGATYCLFAPTTSSTTPRLTTSTTLALAQQTTSGAGSTTPTAVVTNCSAGYYRAGSGSNQCLQCGAGTFKATSDASTFCLNCAAGTYTAWVGYTYCLECPYNFYVSAPGRSMCDPCGGGKETKQSGSNSSAQCACPPLYYEISGLCWDCPRGTYQPDWNAQGFGSCRQCAAGTYGSQFGTSNDVCKSCEPGKFSAQTGQSECLLCPVGFFTKSNASTQCYACDEGKFSNLARNDCEMCGRTQYFCNDTLGRGSAESYCPTGSIGYVTNGNAETLQWKLFPFQTDSTGRFSVDIYRRFVPNFDDVYLQFFNFGVPGCSESSPCFIFEYSFYFYKSISKFYFTGMRNILVVFKSYRWHGEQPFFNMTWTTQQNPCIQCKGNTMSMTATAPYCTACDYGYYMVNSTTCLPCPAGYFCPFKCMHGYYFFNSSTCVPCPRGYFCPTTVGIVKCENNTWSNLTMQNTSAACAYRCESCELGRYRLGCSGPSAGTCVDCPANTYGGGLTNLTGCTPCPNSSVSQQGSRLATDCNCSGLNQVLDGFCRPCGANMTVKDARCVCEANLYGVYPGECKRCPGTSMSLPGAAASTDCFCPEASSDACKCPDGQQLSQGVCRPCYGDMVKVGYYCVCKENFYGNFADGCVPCGLNKVSPLNSLTEASCSCLPNFSPPSCTVCLPGFYLANGSCLACPAGSVCSNGVTAVPCGGKRWGSVAGQSTFAAACPNPCGTCDPGYAKANCSGSSAGVCVPCAAGTYGGGVGVTSECTRCPDGSTSDPARSSILDCKCAGSRQISGASCVDCGPNMTKVGDFCVCVANFYGSFLGGCAPCRENSFSVVDTQVESGCVCSANYLLPLCQRCVPGFFRNASRLCQVCPANYECDGLNALCGNGTYKDAAGVCQACTAGYYCPDRLNRYPCRNNSVQADSKLVCSCVNGFLEPACDTCAAGSYILNGVCSACPLNFFCPDGRSAYPCPQYRAAAAGSSFCTCQADRTGLNCDKCVLGYYRTGTGNATVCNQCEAGFYCPDGVERQVCTGISFSSAGAAQCSCPSPFKNPPVCDSCDVGEYLQNNQICWPCQPGNYCPDRKNFVSCPEFYYGRNVWGQSTFEAACIPCECPVGQYITRCAYGYVISPAECASCPSGKYWIPTNRTHSCTNCPAGASNSPEGSTSVDQCVCDAPLILQNGQCVPCPANTSYLNGVCVCANGFYLGSGICTKCPPGKLSLVNSQSVTDCFDKCPNWHCGWYMDFTENICKLCEGGAYCPDSVTRIPCPPITYMPYYFSGKCTADNCYQCQKCNNGDFFEPRPDLSVVGVYRSNCGGTNYGTCFICPMGFYCPNNDYIFPCNADYWGNITGQFTSALACPYPCADCPLGRYKVGCGGNRTGTCVACPPNTYGAGSGALNDSACVACPPRMLSLAGSGTVDDCFCPAPYTVMNRTCVCKANLYGTFATRCTPCPAGRISRPNATQVGDCFCPDFTILQGGVCAACPPGSTWVAGQCVCSPNFYGNFTAGCLPCQPNSASPLGSLQKSQCACNANFQAPDCLRCNAGFFLFNSTCSSCSPGFYCADGLAQTPCNGGYWGNVGGQSTFAAACQFFCGTCPAAQYKVNCSGVSIGVCVSCPDNSENFGGAMSISSCVPKSRYYGVSPTFFPCTANSYCPGFLSLPLPCPKNTHSSVLSNVITNCSANAGYYGQPGTDPFDCPEHHYCLVDSLSPTHCPANSNSPLRSTSNFSCVANAGYFGLPGTFFTLCYSFHYCPVGAFVPQRCPDNSFSNPGSSSLYNCLANAGYYGSASLIEAVPGGRRRLLQSYQYFFECPVDSYCPEGSIVYTPCPNFTTSLALSDELVDCVSKPGYAGAPGVQASLCPPNTYCPRNSTNATACPGNSSSPAGSPAASSCKANAGFYGAYGAAVSPCLPNNYCPAGSVTPTPCPAGYGSPVGSAQLSDCKLLPVLTTTSTSQAPTSTTSTSLPASTSTTSTSSAPTSTTSAYLPASTSTTSASVLAPPGTTSPGPAATGTTLAGPAPASTTSPAAPPPPAPPSPAAEASGVNVTMIAGISAAVVLVLVLVVVIWRCRSNVGGAYAKLPRQNQQGDMKAARKFEVPPYWLDVYAH